jgi:O-antigen/teichoic acid export membrane protein
VKFNFLQTSFVIFIVANSSNVVQYLSQIVLGRYLSVADYGIYNSVQSLSLTVVSFIAIIPFVVSKFMIEFQDDIIYRNSIIRKIFGYIVIINSLFCIILYLLSYQIGVFLKIYELTPIYIFIVSIYFTVIYTYFDSILRGLRLYISSTLQGTILTVLRFSFIIILVVFMHKSYNGALIANVVATIIILLIIYLYNVKGILSSNNDYSSLQSHNNPLINILKYSIPVGITWIILVLISYSDIIFVKHYFDDYQTGMYSSASVIGKIGFFLSSVLMTAFFPEVVNNEKIEKSSLPILLMIMLLTIIVSAAYVFIVYSFKDMLIILFFGEKYLLAGEYLTRITIFMSIAGIITVLFNFFLAKEIYHYLYISVIVMFFGGLTFVLREMRSPNDILNIFLSISTALLVTTVLYTLYHYRKHLYEWVLNRQ